MTSDPQVSLPLQRVTSVQVVGAKGTPMYNVMARIPMRMEQNGYFYPAGLYRIYGPTDIRTAKLLRDDYRKAIEAAKVVLGLKEPT